MTEDKPKRRARRQPMPDSFDAVEIALGAAASGKPLPEIARRLLEEQSLLIRAQTAELRLRHVGNSVRAVLWALLALLAAGLLALLVSVVLRASRTDALLIESFQVPPAMAAQGLTGQVIATQVLDRLAMMQAKSESTRAASTYANNWGDDLKIDIPNTGATADQLWKLLRGWLGKETRISGEVAQGKDGLSLTARVGARPGERFAGGPDDLDQLVTRAAEMIYRETQPYRYTVYIDEFPERAAENDALLVELTASDSPIERKWAWNGLSVSERNRGNVHASRAHAMKALAIDPKMHPALGNLLSAESLLGHDEHVLAVFDRQEGITVGDEYDRRIVTANRCRVMSVLLELRRDTALILPIRQCIEQAGGSRLGRINPYIDAHEALLRHDRRALGDVRLPDGDASYSAMERAFIDLQGALEDGDRRELPLRLATLRSAIHAAMTTPAAGYLRSQLPVKVWPAEAVALARAGRAAEAQALIDRTPRDCYECVRARGTVAWARGDRVDAQRWFAEAVRQGPSLPAAYQDWGRLLLEARRHDDAEKKFAAAIKASSSGWADPFKALGDSFAARGRFDEAKAHYDTAATLAPDWAALHKARARLERGRKTA